MNYFALRMHQSMPAEASPHTIQGVGEPTVIPRRPPS